MRTCPLFYEMTKAFLALAKALAGDIFPFLEVHAIILINFSFSRKANAKNQLECWQSLSRCFLEKVELCLNIRIEFRRREIRWTQV
ncbi:hypothetical protein HMPREF2991_00310 [Streptococcus sp. HMSC072D07]|nr:hypothetical protein HMPREF2766_00585 [Streptococcus sp. HMSC076C08]OFP31382.1 hypothetical protein HMPREF2991_00310 [Streptococcus sp. HMSC072D07]